MRFRFHPDALAEYLAAADRYEHQVAGLADRFESELFAVLDLIAEFPNLGKPRFGNVRSLGLNRFPFDVVHSIEGETIVIYAIAHRSRRPGYWRQ